jgi:hypothetical protein
MWETGIPTGLWCGGQPEVHRIGGLDMHIRNSTARTGSITMNPSIHFMHHRPVTTSAQSECSATRSTAQGSTLPHSRSYRRRLVLRFGPFRTLEFTSLASQERPLGSPVWNGEGEHWVSHPFFLGSFTCISYSLLVQQGVPLPLSRLNLGCTRWLGFT